MGAWKGVMWFRYLLAGPSEPMAEQAQLIAYMEIERTPIQARHHLTPLSHS